MFWRMFFATNVLGGLKSLPVIENRDEVLNWSLPSTQIMFKKKNFLLVNCGIHYSVPMIIILLFLIQAAVSLWFFLRRGAQAGLLINRFLLFPVTCEIFFKSLSVASDLRSSSLFNRSL